MAGECTVSVLPVRGCFDTSTVQSNPRSFDAQMTLEVYRCA